MEYKTKFAVKQVVKRRGLNEPVGIIHSILIRDAGIQYTMVGSDDLYWESELADATVADPPAPRTVTKVQLTFADGSVKELEGEDAAKWQSACDSQATMAFVHGSEFPELNWKVIPPPKTAEEKPVAAEAKTKFSKGQCVRVIKNRRACGTIYIVDTRKTPTQYAFGPWWADEDELEAIQLPSQKVCPNCKGTKTLMADDNEDEYECPQCSGTGLLWF